MKAKRWVLTLIFKGSQFKNGVYFSQCLRLILCKVCQIRRTVLGRGDIACQCQSINLNPPVLSDVGYIQDQKVMKFILTMNAFICTCLMSASSHLADRKLMHWLQWACEYNQCSKQWKMQKIKKKSEKNGQWLTVFK